jgi:hypothetical protein
VVKIFTVNKLKFSIFLWVICCSSAGAAPQVIKKIPAKLLGDASRQNVFVLTGDAGEAYHRLLISPEQGASDDILLDTSTALPLIKSQYSAVMSEGFSVNVINSPAGVLKVVDVQGETVSVKQPSAEAGDAFVLVSNEEDNEQRCL